LFDRPKALPGKSPVTSVTHSFAKKGEGGGNFLGEHSLATALIG